MGILSKSGLNPSGRAADEGFVDIDDYTHLNPSPADTSASTPEPASVTASAPMPAPKHPKKHPEDKDHTMPDMDCANLARGIASALDRFLAEQPAPAPGQSGGSILGAWRARTSHQHVRDCRDHALMLARAFEQGGPERVSEAARAFAQSADLAGSVLSRGGVKLTRAQQEALAAMGHQAATLADRLKSAMPDIARAIGRAIEQLMNRLIRREDAPAQSTN